MEEQIRNIVQQSLLVRAEMLSEDYDYIATHQFRCLPMVGDIIRYNYNEYEVIRREFELDNCYRYGDIVEATCRIIVKVLKEEEEE